jgi:hypothetical protein
MIRPWSVPLGKKKHRRDLRTICGATEKGEVMPELDDKLADASANIAFIRRWTDPSVIGT